MLLCSILWGGCIQPIGVGVLPDATVASSGDEESGERTASGSATGPGAGHTDDEPPELFAIVLAAEDVYGDDGTGTGGSPGEGTAGSGAVVVRLSNAAISCADPIWLLPCDDHWAIFFDLSPDDLQQGASGQLVDLLGTLQVAPAIAGRRCMVDKQAVSGTFEILSVDPAALEIQLDDLVPSEGSPPALTFVAQRC